MDELTDPTVYHGNSPMLSRQLPMSLCLLMLMLPVMSCIKLSDHNLVHLLPLYKPLVHREPAITRTVKKWTAETEEALKDCFNTTLWEELCDLYGEDIDGLTHCRIDYVNSCVENTVPTKTVRCFSNNKLWINPDIKALLKDTQRAFRSGDNEEMKVVQRELRRKTWEGKASYRRKMEVKLQQSNPSPNGSPADNPQSSTQLPQSSLTFSTSQVRSELRKIKTRKAAGPDGISSRLLKSCANELCGMAGHIFNLSLRLGRVPQLWKTSCVVPVPKTPHPKDLNSYRLVALTSHLMKTLERLLLVHLRPLVSLAMDPLQFAYQPGIGVEDAIIHLLHRSLSHLENAGSTVRIMFFDFSSAVSTIQPMLLKDKLECTALDHHLTTWIVDYLTNRPHDGDDREWCQRNCLQINARKTKELVVDFRRAKHSPPVPVNIQGTDTEIVRSYKYLGVHLNNKLD
ncbi:hypothetical protein NFI96_003160 [Prochilodus magdalenae]|nr:hypothetical protein NFI96_003160 [Prochilodus magdalenae]